MKDKNVVISNYCNSLVNMVSNLVGGLSNLTDDDVVVNNGIIKTADININAINSQIIVLQNELDNYMRVEI